MNFSNTTSASSSQEPSLFLPIMSLEGLEPPTHQQFWDFETNGNLNSNTFICPPHNNFLGFSNSFQTSFPHSSYSHIPEFQSGYLKREDGCSGLDVGAYNSARIGLNLGHRTYFSSRETAVIDRLFKRSRGFYHGNQVPRCQAEGCKVDLTNAKHYHRRHKVCEFHSKASKVVASGVEQRFCQQCSRFHVLAEFDEVKRSCRKRLEDHNRRRRKSHHLPRTSEKDTKANEKSPSLPLLMGKGKKDQTKQKIVFAETQKEAAAGGLSLGGVAQIERSSFSSSSSSFLEREAANVSLSPPCHEQSQQRAEELHNLFHLGQTIFEMEML